MAVGRAQHLQLAGATPTLGHQLLTGIDGEASVPLPRYGPDIATGPQQPQAPGVRAAVPQQQRTTLIGGGTGQQPLQNDQQASICHKGGWRGAGHTDTLWAILPAVLPRPMTETSVTSPDQDAVDQTTAVVGETGSEGEALGQQFSERYSEILGKVNQTLDQVDWSQMGRIGKSVGILLAVIIAQVLIKGVLDTINLLPIVPGLLELLGLVVVGQWSWQNLTTSEKRSAVVSKLQHLRQEYLG
jgi:hypothetical protein